MAGLLDLANDPMMGLAAGLLGGGNFGTALQRGLTASQAMQMAEEERKLRASQARENEMRAREYQDRIEQAKAVAQRDAMFQGALGGQRPRQTPIDNPMSQGGPLMSMGGPLMGGKQEQQGTDWNALAMQFPDKIELIKKLSEANNFGRPTVARTIETMENGRPVTIQLDAQGNRIGSGMEQWKAPVQVSQGDRNTFIDPVTLQPKGSFNINQSPDSLASNALTMRGQNMTDSRARERMAFDQKGGAEAGKPPAGYRWKPDGSLEAIAGGPAAGNKLTESEGKSTLYLSQMREATKALNGIDGAVSPLMVAATGSPYTNWMAGDNSQKAGQSQRQWAEAYLREKTGAAATAGEVENNIKTFFPVVGDSAAVIAQKKAARADAEKAMEIPAGRGAARIPGAVPMMDAKPVANASNRGKVIRETDANGNPTGKSFKSNGMQWVEQ